MFNDDKTIAIVFNGEIYNYLELKKELGGKYKSGSDTEALIRAYQKWGEKCLEKLNGIEGRLTTKLASLEKQIQTKAAKPVKTVTKKVTKVVKKKVPVIKRKVMVKKVPVVKKQIIVKKIAKKAAKKFIAHKITKKLHDPHCPYAKNILPKTKRLFRSKTAALNKGFKLCTCLKK